MEFEIGNKVRFKDCILNEARKSLSNEAKIKLFGKERLENNYRKKIGIHTIERIDTNHSHGRAKLYKLDSHLGTLPAGAIEQVKLEND